MKAAAAQGAAQPGSQPRPRLQGSQVPASLHADLPVRARGQVPDDVVESLRETGGDLVSTIVGEIVSIGTILILATFLLFFFLRAGCPIESKFQELDRAALRRLFYGIALGATALQLLFGPLVLLSSIQSMRTKILFSQPEVKLSVG